MGHERELRVPKCYYTEDIDLEKEQFGLLVLEDLSVEGYVRRLGDVLGLPLIKDVISNRNSELDV